MLKLLSAIVLAFVLPAHAQMPDFTRLVRDEGAAVVNISTAYRVTSESPLATLPDEIEDEQLRELLKRFIGPDAGRRFDGDSLGSGFIISEEGYIITNAHLVDEAESRDIVVRLADRREFDARLVGLDVESDIALLKIEAAGLQAVRIGDAEKLLQGEWVAAIGSPFGFERSITAGIVSAKRRSLGEVPVPFIQTDVAVNPGNSGGPLFNLRGEVVGVNSLIFSASGGYMGLSFAIPIGLAMEVAGQLRAKGKVAHGALGMRVQEVTADLARALRLPGMAGALVSDLTVNPPPGIRPGDVIVSFAGQPVESVADLAFFLSRSVPGTKAAIELVRNGRRLAIDVPIIERRDAVEAAAPPAPSRQADPLGLQLAPASPAERVSLGIESGLLVRRAEGAGARAGLRRGDVILSADGNDVRTVEEFRGHISKAGPGSTIALRVQRGGTRIYAALRIPR